MSINEKENDNANVHENVDVTEDNINDDSLQYDEVNETDVTKKSRRKTLIKKSIIIVLAYALLAVLMVIIFSAVKTSKSIVPAAPEIITYDNNVQPCSEFTEFNCNVEWIISDNVPNGVFVNQSVLAGEKLEVESDITLFYSKGPAEAKLPEIVGLTIEEATEKLYALGFVVDKINETPGGGIEKGRVVSTVREAGTVLPNGEKIVLNVSNGSIVVPDWTEKSREYVEAEAQELNLTVTFEEEESDVTPGIVIGQTPVGDTVSNSNEITVVISSAPEKIEFEVPDVLGIKAEDAQTRLAVVGFRQIKTIVVKNSEVETEQVTQIVPNVGQTVDRDENIVLIVSEPYTEKDE